ncbi:MAG TPA: glycerol-3-phosphate dehydrogenase/oxidase [Candidatus Elarobacter sp.]|nr:glycerol-3-phosphate dehydrogenase/oxidase [Candidatus Elarobacter sp.]
MLVIGGGATGLGAAVDAAARGYHTALVEAEDFAAATSSRSTKLIHGGVRYLQQGNVALVREALRERTALFRNAPHLVTAREFVVPAYRWFEIPYYAAGLAAYDVLAGRSELPRSRVVSAAQARARIPVLVPQSLCGAIVYDDGQFDDARLAITLARTAVDLGATAANYLRVTGFIYDANGRVAGAAAVERESGADIVVRARVTINATGIFADQVRALDDPAAPKLLALSRGSHVVVRSEALGGASSALLVPKTADGRVLFAIPWYDRVVIGTTDVPVTAPELDPLPSAREIAYILATVNRYLTRPLAAGDVVAAFAGLRPLIARKRATTAQLSREHLIVVARSGLVTVAGGKWTTYRKMAEDVVDVASRAASLTPAPSQTEYMPLHGAVAAVEPEAALRGCTLADEALRPYGSDAHALLRLIADDPRLAEPLDARLPYTGANVVYAVRAEMARTAEDVLSRRTRARFLDADAARASEPRVASLVAAERIQGT